MNGDPFEYLFSDIESSLEARDIVAVPWGGAQSVAGRAQERFIKLFVLVTLILLGGLFAQMMMSQGQVKRFALAARSHIPPEVTLAAVAELQSSPSPRLTVVASATPTEPSSPTPTASPTFTPSPTPSPTPLPSPTFTPSPVPLVVPSPFPESGPRTYVPSTTLPIPTPVSPVPVAADAINIVVLGSDRRSDWTEWHTDVVQVVSIQRDTGVVSVISVPRDLYVYIPEFWMSRINFADFYGETYDYEGGGRALVRDTLLYNLGIRVDHYVRTDFDGLINVVDALDGVDIPVHCRLQDYWPYPDEDGEYHIKVMEPGIRHMDGKTALWYARSRKTTSVFDREWRQQQVLQALWYKVRDAGVLTRVPALWREWRDTVVTDLTLPDLLRLARIALTLEEQDIRFYNINAEVVSPWTTPYGGYVFLPRWEKIRPIVAEAMAPAPEERVGRTYLPVEVWNGSSNPDWDLLAADRLNRAGFPAVVGEPDQAYAETQLIVLSQRLKGSGAGYLQEVFDLPDEQVIHRPGVSSDFGFRLIVGDDYQVCPDPGR